MLLLSLLLLQTIDLDDSGSVDLAELNVGLKVNEETERGARSLEPVT